MSKLGITARIAGGFGAIILLLVVVSLAAVLGIQTLSGVADKYRFANGQAGEITDYVADYHEMVVSVQHYLLAPSAAGAEEAYVWIDDVATNDPEGVAKFESLPVARAEISKIEVSAAALREGFQQIIGLEEQRAGLSQQVGTIYEGFDLGMKTFIDQSEQLNRGPISAEVSRAVKDIMTMEGLSVTYMSDYDDATLDRVREYAASAIEKLNGIKAATANPGMMQESDKLAGDTTAFLDALNALHALNQQVAQITSETLTVRSQELADSYDILTAEVRGAQDALGPLSEQTASGTMLVVSIVAALAVIIGAGLAFITGRWLSTTIGGMSQNMHRMADGDLDIELGPAPKAAELGLMASALETFRTNGLAVRSMDAEKEQAREKELAEQAIRNQLQEEVATVVSAAVSGDFSKRIEGHYDSDDMNALARAVNDLVDTVDRGVGETGEVLAALANTDLTRRMSGHYQGAFDQLKLNTNAVADKLVEIVGRLKQTSRGLKTATGEILSGANDLSERTTKQAATIEETSAAMEQLAHTVMENAKKAGSASDQAESASRTAEEGGEVMSRANQAMERISTSSSKISNIIGMIDDIAFQTNLLALNASVEAARAGEAGKGFAVVAVEVRRLAQSAAEASSEVKVLIEQSGEEVSGGTKLVAEAAEKLSSMLEAVRTNASQMEQIARESREQASAIEEVNVAVRQMDEMTQHNAALVEETNAAIEQTESQASDLDRIVEVFTISSSPSAAPALTPAPAPAKPAEARSGIKGLQDKVTSAAKTYLSKGNAAVDQDWSEF